MSQFIQSIDSRNRTKTYYLKCWPGNGAFPVATAHRANDDNVAGQTDYESDDMRQNNRHEIGIILPWQQHFFGIFHKDKGMRPGQFTFSTNKIYFTRIREYVTMRTLSHRVRYALHRNKEIGGDLSFPPSARTRKREKTCGLTQQRLDGICGLVAASVEWQQIVLGRQIQRINLQSMPVGAIMFTRHHRQITHGVFEMLLLALETAVVLLLFCLAHWRVHLRSDTFNFSAELARSRTRRLLSLSLLRSPAGCLFPPIHLVGPAEGHMRFHVADGGDGGGLETKCALSFFWIHQL